MTDSKALRRHAALARRAATVHTSGDSTINRDLNELADKLEWRAEEQERVRGEPRR